MGAAGQQPAQNAAQRPMGPRGSQSALAEPEQENDGWPSR